MLSSTAMAPGSNGGGVRGYLEMGTLKDEEAREDYYLEGGTAKAEFHGGAMTRLGITSEYKQEDFERLFNGSAKDGTPLTQGKANSRVPGWDLTFSAPKSVSAIWAVAETELQQHIESIHDNAVRETLDYLQRQIPIVNVGRGQRISERKFSVKTETGKIAAALFRHGTSRAQDPDLHTHSLLFNVALRADGKLLSLNSTELFDRIKELGAIYRISLANKLQDLGFGIEHDKQSFRVFGVSADLVNHWSTRRQQIEEKLNESGKTGSKAATLANLSTREGKESVATDELKSDWQQAGRHYHFDAKSIRSLRQHDYTEEKDLFKNIVSPGIPDFSTMLSKMTEFESALEPKKARETIIQALQGKLTVSETEKYVERFFSHENTDLLHLTHNGKDYVTAREIYDIEFENKEIALSLHQSPHKSVSDRAFERGMRQFVKRNGFELSEEQFSAVKHITQDTGALALVEGSAGAGKSTALEAALYIWNKQGLSVRGAAPQGTAANNLQKEIGMPATTVHKLLLDNQAYIGKNGMKKSAFRPITKYDVIVVDESGALDSRTMNRLEKAVHAAGAKLVLVGDTAQTQPVPAGGASNALKQEIPFATLVENRRQKNELTLSTVTDIKSKNPLQALSRLLEHNKLSLPGDGASAIKHTADRWHDHISDASLDRSIMITNTNAEVKALNELARQRLSAQGKIATHTEVSVSISDKDGADLGSRKFAEGDLILFRKNNARLGVSNGLRAVIKDIVPAKRGGFDIVAQDLGGKSVTHRQIRFNTTDYNTFNYGYAVTTNGAQSISIDHASILVGRGVENYHAAYVQVSRVKHDIHLTIPKSADVVKVLEGPPSANMIAYAQDLAKKNGLPAQDFTTQPFQTVRDFLNKYGKESMGPKQQEDLGPLEAVSSVIKSMKREQIKKTTLQFTLSSGLSKPEAPQNKPQQSPTQASARRQPQASVKLADKAQITAGLDRGNIEQQPQQTKDVLVN